jgi:excisionase family DNA binding protein
MKITTVDVFRLPRPLTLTHDDAARALGVSVGTVFNLIRRGALRAVMIGKRQKVRADDLYDYVEKQSVRYHPDLETAAA